MRAFTCVSLRRLLCAVAVAACHVPSVAQSPAGRIAGLIMDRTGGVIAGARVTAINRDTGVRLASVSNEQGQYLLYPLAPGIYDITVHANGFRTEHLEEVRVDVAAAVTRNVTLEVGAVEQTVVVTAEAAQMINQAISVESTVVREQIEFLPMNGRDFNQLVLLAAGAVENINSGNGKDFGAVAASGNRAFSNDYLLDGTPNNDVFQGRSGAAVSIDVIREFKVISGIAPAEYGQAGAQIAVVTRGGTNQFRGSVLEYHRGNTGQARNPFNTVGEQPFLRNQFGASLGGPLVRNRAFFFLNYEGNRQRENVTRLATVPRPEFWKGDFSALLSRGIVLRDPLDAARPVIPGNRLDQYLGGQRISRLAPRLRPFWPDPNREGWAYNLLQFPKESVDGDQFTIRLDQVLPRGHGLALRYTQAENRGFTPSILGNGAGLYAPTENHNVNATWTATITASTVNELRVGYARYSQSTRYETGGLPTVESLGLKGFEPAGVTLPPMPRIVFTGADAFTQLNYGGNENYGMAALVKVSKTTSLSQAVTHSRGRHVVKAGWELRSLDLPCLQQTNARGQIRFRAATSGLSAGYTFADFLMGVPGSSQEVPVKKPVLLHQRELALYAQDDWRLNPRLTLTLGLRYELFFNPYEDRNRLAMFEPVSGAIVVASDRGRLPVEEFLPAVISKLRDAQGRWRFPLLSDQEAGLTPRRLVDPRYRYFSPRAGFVRQLDARGKTLIRGGYGIFYTRYPVQYLLQTIAVNPPFAGLFTHSQRLTELGPALTLEAPYAAAGSASVSPAGLQRDFRLPDNQQWTLGVERELGRSTALSLAYVGNKGTHLFRSVNANGPYLDPVNRVVRRRFSDTFGTSTINVRMTNGNSIYNALQAEVRRRARRGLSFQVNWTWAKGIDDVGPTVQSALLDVENLGRDRADSDYVRRHLVKANGAYELPFGRGKALLNSGPRWLDWMVGGWRLAGIWHYTTGMRFTPQFSTTGGLNNNRPDVVPGERANLPRRARKPSGWFNPKAFAEVPALDPATGLPRFGNAGRNILIGPGLNIADLSLAKLVPLRGERWKLSFRMEAFNAFNHANYDFPDNNISNTNTVAKISRTVKPMRQMQFALRLDF